MGPTSQADVSATSTDSSASGYVPTCAESVSPVALAGSLLLLCGLVLLTWSASMAGSFQFDDYGEIVNNSKVRKLWPLDDFISHNRPLGLYTFALNFAAGGLNPAGYHAVNLLIHLAAAVTLLFLVRSILTLPRFERHGWNSTSSFWMAWCCAAIWAVHPLTTQAVTYIVQRYESLAALCGLFALLSMCQVAKGRRWWIVPAGIAGWMGILSKEPMAMIPLIALAFDRAVLQPEPQRESSGNDGTPRSECDSPRQSHWRWRLYLALCSGWLWFAPSVSR